MPFQNDRSRYRDQPCRKRWKDPIGREKSHFQDRLHEVCLTQYIYIYIYIYIYMYIYIYIYIYIIYIVGWDNASERAKQFVTKIRPFRIRHNNYKALILKTIDKMVILNVYIHTYIIYMHIDIPAYTYGHISIHTYTLQIYICTI